MERTTLEGFYKDCAGILPPNIEREIGHFNVFKTAEFWARVKAKTTMPYSRRDYYKIALVRGKNTAEYADKTIRIERNALLFATPKVPYNWLPDDSEQAGDFCIFTGEFLMKNRGGVPLDELPIFAPGGYPVFLLTDSQADEIGHVFQKMEQEINSSYAFKYDLLRNYLMELIHFGQKLQPATAAYLPQNASARVASLFVELLERQFPIESFGQKLTLRTAKNYADQLAVHVNHLNKILKETTGKTTTDLIANRVVQEAKILLKQTDWNVSEISDCLGFEEVAHFSNFFRKHTSLSPAAFRA